MKLRIILKAYSNELANLACEQLRSALLATNCEISGVVALPTRIKRFCVLRSPHVDKDSREHFEVRFSKRILDISASSTSIINTLLKIEMPSGVSCSIKTIESSKKKKES